MQINSEQLNAAMSAAIALTNPADDRCTVSMRHAAGALILHQLAIAIQNGEFALAPAGQKDPAAPTPAPELKPVPTPEPDKKPAGKSK